MIRSVQGFSVQEEGGAKKIYARCPLVGSCNPSKKNVDRETAIL